MEPNRWTPVKYDYDAVAMDNVVIERAPVTGLDKGIALDYALNAYPSDVAAIENDETGRILPASLASILRSVKAERTGASLRKLAEG